MQGGAPAVDVRFRDVGVRLVGGDETEVSPLLGGEPRQIVELEVHGLDRILEELARVAEPVVDVVLAFAPHGPDELDDGVIEVQAHAHLRGAGLDLVALHLGDELLEGAGGETVALVDVQVDVVGLDDGTQILLGQGGAVVCLQHDDRAQSAASARGLHAGLQVREADVQLNAVELQGDHREGVTAALGEPERERDIEAAGVARVVDQVLQTAVLTDHLTKPLPRLSRKFFPHVQVVVVQSINDLTSDDEGRSADEPLSDRIGVMSVRTILADVIGVAAAVHIVVTIAVPARIAVRAVLTTGETWVWLREQGHLGIDAAGRSVLACFDAWQINHNIEVIDQIACSVESQLRVAAEHHLCVERLLDRFHGEVGIPRIPEAPECDGRVLGKILVSSSEGNQLRQSSSLGGSNRTTSHEFRFFHT